MAKAAPGLLQRPLAGSNRRRMIRTEFSPDGAPPCPATSSASPNLRTTPAPGWSVCKAKAVVQSYESYQQTQFSLALLTRLNRALSDVQTGRAKPQDQVFEEARSRLEKRLARG